MNNAWINLLNGIYRKKYLAIWLIACLPLIRLGEFLADYSIGDKDGYFTTPLLSFILSLIYGSIFLFILIVLFFQFKPPKILVYLKDNLDKSHFRAWYFILLFGIIFFSSYKVYPEIHDDSQVYLRLSKNMTIKDCFTDNSLRDNKDITLLAYVRRNTCFLLLNRPFIYPLLLRICVDNIILTNLFQNIVRGLAWLFLIYVVWFVNLQTWSKCLLHILLIICSYKLPQHFNNAIMTEDLNLSLWIISIGLLIIVLFFPKVPSRGMLLVFITYNLIVLLLLFLRSHNFLVVTAYMVIFYSVSGIVLKKHQVPIRTIILSITITLVLLIMSSVLTLISERYLHTFTNQINFYLGGEYYSWARDEYPYLFSPDKPDVRDSQWFFDSYPEVEKLGVPTMKWDRISHPFIKWQIDNIKEVWSHYVITHIDDFMKLQYLWLKKTLNKSRFLQFMLGISFLIMIYYLKFIKTEYRKVIVSITLYFLVFVDSFVALIGDFPGELLRHTFLARNVYFLLMVILFTFTIDEILQYLNRMHKKGI